MPSIEFLPVTMGTAQVPYLRRNQPTTTSVIAMNPQDKTRLIRYEECWRFFQGLQWGITRDDGDPLITANICRVIIHKLATWMVGKGMEISVVEALAELTLPVLEEVWKANNKDALLFEMAVGAGVTGDGFVLVTSQPPTVLERMLDPYTQGKIRIRYMGSHQVFPQWDPRNKERLLAVKIITEEADNRMPDIVPQNGAVVDGVNAHGRQMRRYVETITPEFIIEGYEDEQQQVRSNDLGEIPLVHWPNVSFPGEYYGLSDLDGIIDMQRELNQKLTNMSDIVHIHAAPITVVTGAKASSLEKGPRQMWAFPNPLVKVETLSATGDINSILDYIKFVMQMIFDMSGVPEGSLGRIQAISNTSGIALEVQFGPLMEAVLRKSVNFIIAIQMINYFILRLWQITSGKSLPTNICATCGGGIIELPEVGEDGITRIRKKCYILDPVTMDFMKPENVRVRWKSQFSFGEVTRELPYWRVKQDFGKKSTSYWDPSPQKDLQKEAELQQQQAQAAQQQQLDQEQQSAEADHQRQMELKGNDE